MKRIITVLIIIMLATPTYAYTADPYTNIQGTAKVGYTADPYTNIQGIAGSDEGGGTNPCDCTGLNTNWAVDLSQYCILSTTCDLGTGNMTFTGAGNFTINSALTVRNFGPVPTTPSIWIGLLGVLRVLG